MATSVGWWALRRCINESICARKNSKGNEKGLRVQALSRCIMDTAPYQPLSLTGSQTLAGSCAFAPHRLHDTVAFFDRERAFESSSTLHILSFQVSPLMAQ